MTVILGDLEFDNVMYDGGPTSCTSTLETRPPRSSSTSRRKATRCAMTPGAAS